MGVRVISEDRLHQMVELEKYTKIENEFTNMAKELLAARVKIKAADELAESVETLNCEITESGWECLKKEIEKYRKAGESDDRHCLHCGKNLGSDLPNVKWCNTDCMDAGESEGTKGGTFTCLTCYDTGILLQAGNVKSFCGCATGRRKGESEGVK